MLADTSMEMVNGMPSLPSPMRTWVQRSCLLAVTQGVEFFDKREYAIAILGGPQFRNVVDAPSWPLPSTLTLLTLLKISAGHFRS